MRLLLLLAGSSLLLLPACHDSNSTPAAAPAPDPDPAPEPLPLGSPRPDLTEEELAAFERGKALFTKRFKPSDGLGPLYNATSCASCHSKPVIGGTAELYRNFYVAVWDVTPTFQFNLPGLPSPVIPAFGTQAQPTFTLEGQRLTMPAELSGLPVTHGQRNSIPMFGVGMFEFISNATILSNADPEDEDGDGISGRTNADGAGMGRFGTKSQSNNIEFFTRAPLMNQLGITSDPFDGTNGTISLAHGMAPQGIGTPNAPTADNDGVPDPEISREDLGDLIAFSRFLAAPEPRPFDEAAVSGQATFGEIGCAKCHIPELPSSRGPVRAYTDLLLHDMGPDLAEGINFGTAQASPSSPASNGAEWRTAPLWGVSHFSPYLHDGRAATLDEAIRLHGGEASLIRDAYVALPELDRENLLAFLRHL